jgi:hypothetical protein
MIQINGIDYLHVSQAAKQFGPAIVSRHTLGQGRVIVKGQQYIRRGALESPLVVPFRSEEFHTRMLFKEMCPRSVQVRRRRSEVVQ